MEESSTIFAGVMLTEAAARESLSRLSNETEPDGKGLRVFIEPGGCSGIQYAMTFDEPREGDTVNECFGIRVLVDKVSREYLEGTTIDFSDALTDGGYKWINPKAKQSCGCGRSFEV